MDARLELLDRLAAFARARGLGTCAAMAEFCALYSTGELAVSAPARACIGTGLHPATLRRWRRTLRVQGPAALAGRYGNRAGSEQLDTEADLREFVLGLITTQPRISARLVHDALDARFGGDERTLSDLRTVQRWLKQWKIEHAEVYLASTNPDAWKNRYLAAFGSLTEPITRACQVWQLDSTPADLQLVDGRYSLVVIIAIGLSLLRACAN